VSFGLAGRYSPGMAEEVRPAIPPKGDPWRDNELERRRRIREDAKRPPAVNLAEAMALSEYLSSFAGVARRK